MTEHHPPVDRDMQRGDDRPNGANQPGFWRSRTGLVTIAFLAIAAFYLVAEHRAHLLGWLPWLILLACPLLHVFMHSGHGGHGGQGHGGETGSLPSDGSEAKPHEH